MRRILLPIAVGLAVAAPLQAATSYHGYITQTGTLGDGTVFVEFAAAVGPTGCNHPQVRLAANNPAARQVFAVALAAYLSNSPVQIETDGCLGAYATMTTAGSWLYPKPL
jgi:hypothetical protein